MPSNPMRKGAPRRSRRLRPAAPEALEARRVPAAVSLLKDIFPEGDSAPKNFLAVGGTLFFDPIAPAVGRELWTSDGTPEGTLLVKDIRPGTVGSEPFRMVAAGGRLFFIANDGTAGDELWTSDGTAAGTFLLKDIRPGIEGSDIASLAASGGRVYFAADDGTSGAELWTSDGTIGGTKRVADLNPGPDGSAPYALGDVGGTFFFVADDGTVDESGLSVGGLYSAVDGVAHLVTRKLGVGLARFGCNFNGVLYATDGPNLFRSDGTDAGTQLVKSLVFDIVLPNGDTVSGNGNFGPLAVVNGRIYTEAYDGLGDVITPQLWKSDGTAAGTVPITDFPDGFGADVSGMVGLNGLAYFAGTDSSGGSELWRTDGTAAGTVRVADINPGAADAEPRFLTTLGDFVFFNATGSADGFELWQAGGGISGAVVLEIHPGNPSSFPAFLTRMGNAIYFAATEPDVGREPFKVTVGAPGSVGLASANLAVREAAGILSVVLTRTGGSTGELTVRLTTADGTATAGADYTAVDEIVIWADGDTAPRTILVPILDGAAVEPDETFRLDLDGAAAGGITSAVVTIRDDDATTGPTGPAADLVRVERVSLRKIKGKKGATTVIDVRFSGDVVASRAADRAAYDLSTTGKPKRRGSPPPVLALAIGRVTYDARSRTATIAPLKALKLNPAVILKVLGNLLPDARGLALDGDRDGRPGGVATATLSRSGVTLR